MRYIFFTFDGSGLPIAYHLQKEGCEVSVGQIQNKKDVLPPSQRRGAEEDPVLKGRRLSLYEGMLDKQPAEALVEKMKAIPNPQDYFVFFDFNSLYRYADQIKDLGFLGNFPTELDCRFEMDRGLAKAFAQKNYSHLLVAENREFARAADGLEFLKSSQELWTLKGKDGEARTVVPGGTALGPAREKLMDALSGHADAYEKHGYFLEHFIPSIIELTPEKLYYDGVPIATSLDIENKPLGSGNLSFQTGCAADLVFATDMRDKINQLAFPPIVDEMAKQHPGFFIWDASVLVDSETGKTYFGEYCSNRPGYNSFFTELAHSPSVNQFFESVVQRKNPFVPGAVASSLRIFNLHMEEGGRSLSNGKIEYKPEIEKDLWLWDVHQSVGEGLVSSGAEKSLAVVTGCGTSVTDSVAKMYQAVEGFSFEGAYYRPQFDYLSTEYPTSILNRLNYGAREGLYELHFEVTAPSLPG